MMMPLTVDGWPCSLFYSFFLFFSLTHALERRKTNAIIATVKFEGSERTNTHTHRPHTHICMLSRVAAVKAPRTHNRRRVTGSSGRRREGGESERQRPNMSQHHFYSAVLLLLLLVMMCCGTGGAAAAGEVASPPGSAKGEFFVWRDKKNEENVDPLCVPSLLKVGNDVFAVAQAKCWEKGAGDDFNGIASELLTLSDGTSKALDKAQLKTEVLEECSTNGGNCPSQPVGAADSQCKTKARVIRPTTVVRGSDIYMLAGNYIIESNPPCAVGNSKPFPFELLLVKGNISVENGNNRIYWNDTYVIPWGSNREKLQSFKSVIGGGGSGVKIE
ncbi:trans-sialidase, putative, partial [Trypanosoma cruzi marinkellei]